jgi:hypothetical protein
LQRNDFGYNATLQQIQDNPGTGGGKGQTFAAFFCLPEGRESI